MSRPRSVPARAASAAVLALVVGLLSAAGDPVDAAAERIVAGASDAVPLTVVTTTLDAAGRPVVESTVVRTEGAAEDLVAEALEDGTTVSMAQPVSIDLSNDPLRPRQWGLSALSAETVWRTATGARTSRSRQAVVAVVDTGVRYTHPDLQGNLVTGRDFVDPGTPPGDGNGHGTHVAGTVAARAGNARGVAGLAPGAKIMPVRVLDASGGGTSDDVARGIVWAADRGVEAINLSLGFAGRDASVDAAVAYARRRDVLVVASAGNAGCPFLGAPVEYPAATAGVVGVASVDRTLERSGFSSCGSWVDVAAPGGGIWSTGDPNGRIGACSGVSYCALSGTSMSAPHVAAAGALVMARRGWSAATVAARIESTARDLGPAGRDTSYGAGLLDLRRLLG